MHDCMHMAYGQRLIACLGVIAQNSVQTPPGSKTFKAEMFSDVLGKRSHDVEPAVGKKEE